MSCRHPTRTANEHEVAARVAAEVAAHQRRSRVIATVVDLLGL